MNIIKEVDSFSGRLFFACLVLGYIVWQMIANKIIVIKVNNERKYFV